MGIIEKNIIKNVAKQQGINIEAATEAFNQIGKFTKSCLEESTKNDDGTFDPDSFKVIHISNFGKIVPNNRKIKEINKKKINKNDKSNV
jgi:hypothetical protein